MNDHKFKPEVVRMGVPDKFIEHGTVEQLREIVGLDKKSIKKVLLQ